jgi:CBS domain containing-hemolysin-like protein
MVMRDECSAPDIAALARPLLATTETAPLETLFAEMQRGRIHVALVTDSQCQWTGFVVIRTGEQAALD